jgi:dephospho-CoA kinase
MSSSGADSASREAARGGGCRAPGEKGAGNWPFKVLGVAGGIGSGKSTACKILEELGCLAHIGALCQATAGVLSRTLRTSGYFVVASALPNARALNFFFCWLPASVRSVRRGGGPPQPDADRAAHSAYDPGNAEARGELKRAFEGEPSIFLADGVTVDRSALGDLVFSDPAKLARLEAVVWPHARRRVEEMLDAVRPDPAKIPVVVVEAAMLLDSDWSRWMDGVWVVAAETPLCERRVVDRGGATPEQARQRIRAQSTRRGMQQNLQREVERGTVSAVITNNGSLDDLRELLSAKLNDPSAWYSKDGGAGGEDTRRLERET